MLAYSLAGLNIIGFVVGGVFGVTGGLYKEFGPERVLDTPISESAFLGAGVAAAMAGLRPVVEIYMVDFLGVCMDALLNHASKVELPLRREFAYSQSNIRLARK